MRGYKTLWALFILSFVILHSCVWQAQAQTRVGSTCSQGLTWTWGADDLGRQLSIDTKGRLCTHVTGEYNTTLPTLTDGQRGSIQLSTRAALHTQIMSPDSATPVAASSPADGVSNTGTALRAWTVNNLYNGSTWDRAFTCNLSAVVNVTAAATTELVSLTASQIIRVCAITLTGSAAATTATFVTGTGTNCGTGQSALTGAMRMAADGNIANAAGSGSSLFRGIVSQAVCLTAATGNVTGFITYAKY